MYWLSRIIIILSAIVIGFAVFYLYQSDFSEQNAIQLLVKYSDRVQIGQPVEVGVGIGNNGEKVLHAARLTLILPEGVVFVGEEADKNFITKTIGDIGVGGFNNQDFKILVLGGSQALKQLEATLSYSLAESSSQFETKKTLIYQLKKRLWNLR